MTPETLLETLRLHGRSSVCLVEPRDAREWAEVVAALLAVQRYTPTPSPTPALLEHVDSTLALSARVVELEQELAATQGELFKAAAWLDRSASWRDATFDFAKGPLEAQVVALEAEVASLRAQRDEALARRDALAFDSVPQELTQLREEVARLKTPGPVTPAEAASLILKADDALRVGVYFAEKASERIDAGSEAINALMILAARFKPQSVTQQVDTLNQGDSDAE